MADVRMKWRMGTFVEIANAVNAAQCIPAAQRVKAAVSAPGHEDMPSMVHVVTDPRSGVRDFAHARVVNAYPSAMQVEAKYGSLARAMGSA